MITEQLLSERFEVSFNQIHDALKKIVKIRDDRFSVLVKVGAKHHQAIETYKSDLEQYAKLRNAIVHDKVDIGYYIAEPNIKVVEHIEKIARVLNGPNYATSIATKEVIFYNYEDSILKVIQGIKEHSYSQYPIYRNKECIGLLTTGAIVKWMAINVAENIVKLDCIKVSDILEYEVEHPIAFVPKSINIFEVEEIFENAHKDKKELEAVIITENGKKHEAPLGLITAWDLIEIDYTVE
ncbi:CBS domain-containing protein [Cytobacillus sp. FJAT-54145]|uniref:CBS domain-containing protein n=1 Tax=Cytobacillus spartinae TaxID=3299023 RepID=A0ABW6KFW1_9BACI